jgi:hypothetical protein
MDKLKKLYPIWKWSLLGWIIPLVITLVIVVLVMVYAKDNPFIGIAITGAAVGVIGSICIFGLVTQVVVRASVRGSVVSVMDYQDTLVAYRMVGIPPDYEFSLYPLRQHVQGVIDDLISDSGLLTSIRDKLSSVDVHYRSAGFPELVFVTFKKAGAVAYTDKRTGILRRARGLQRGRWCEIEAEHKGDIVFKEVLISLVKHELAHVLIQRMQPGLSPDGHHGLIRRADKVE